MNKFTMFFLILFFPFLNNTSVYAEKYIYGSVNKRASVNGEDRPLKGVNVRVIRPANFKVNAVSDDTGEFKLKIPKRLDMKSGKKIKISSLYNSNTSNLRMLYPFEGEYFIPESLENDPLKIKMVPSEIFKEAVVAEVKTFSKNEEEIAKKGSKEWNISLAVAKTANETGLSKQQYLNDIKAMTNKIASNPQIYNNQQIYNYARLKNSYFKSHTNNSLINQEVSLIAQQEPSHINNREEWGNQSTPLVQDYNNYSFGITRTQINRLLSPGSSGSIFVAQPRSTADKAAMNETMNNAIRRLNSGSRYNHRAQ